MKKIKSLVIAAALLIAGSANAQKWSEGKVYASPVLEPSENNPKGCYWQIDTLEGTMTATPGDYIIKGVQGEFYPCKPDIFEKTYEKVAEVD